MDTNPYGYDKHASWQGEQNQPYNSTYSGMYMYQQPAAPEAQRAQQATKARIPPARMPKARALALAAFFKRALVVMSLAIFAAFSALVAYHQVGAASTSNTNTSTSSQEQHHGFFNQQGDDNFGNDNSNDGSNSSNTGSSSGSNSNPPSGPVSGSHTS